MNENMLIYKSPLPDIDLFPPSIKPTKNQKLVGYKLVKVKTICGCLNRNPSLEKMTVSGWIWFLISFPFCLCCIPYCMSCSYDVYQEPVFI